MATPEPVAPQYRWILPKYLKSTPETKRLALDYITEGANKDNTFAYYINGLTNPTVGFLYDSSDQDRIELKKRRAQEPHMRAKPSNFFFHREKCLQAFHHIGLDMRGGITGIDRIRVGSIIQQSGFSTASILVTDAEKARRYVNIGVHLDAISLMHEIPKSLEEAVKNYALLLQLTKGGFRTLKEIDEEINE